MKKGANTNLIKEKVRNNKFYQNHIRRRLAHWRSCIFYLRNIIVTGNISRDDLKKRFTVIDDKKVIYLKNPKVASSSIHASFYHINLANDDASIIHKKVWADDANIKKNNLKEYKELFKFTYVRNPFTRIISCYHYKNKCRIYKNHALKCLCELDKDEEFDIFVKKICKIPTPLKDHHFYPQYNLTHDKKGKCLVDYVGKFENLPDDYNVKIADVYGFAHLPHYNKTKSDARWEDYYTIETAELVYRKYRKDFEAFGYEDSYAHLISYLSLRT